MNMRTIKQIELLLENTESVVIEAKHIKNLTISGIKRNMSCNNNSGYDYYICETFVLKVDKEADTIQDTWRRTGGKEPKSVFERLTAWNDIVNIELIYTSGMREEIYLPYRDDSHDANSLQTTFVGERSGKLIICVTEDEDIREAVISSEDTSVFHVARYILEKCGDMTPRHLQLLVYFCQAWYMAWHDKPLFKEEFEAWQDGPSCRELNDMIGGADNVTAETFFAFASSWLTDKEKAVLDEIISKFSTKTEEYIGNIVLFDNAWQDARLLSDCDPCSGEIMNKEDIKQYYKQFCAEKLAAALS